MISPVSWKKSSSFHSEDPITFCDFSTNRSVTIDSMLNVKMNPEASSPIRGADKAA